MDVQKEETFEARALANGTILANGVMGIALAVLFGWLLWVNLSWWVAIIVTVVVILMIVAFVAYSITSSNQTYNEIESLMANNTLTESQKHPQK